MITDIHNALEKKPKMHERLISSLNILLDSVEGTNLLLEYYSNFSNRIFNVRDFKSILNIVYEELRKIYVSQQIELILWHNNQRLVKFGFNDSSKNVTPVEEFTKKNTLYNYVLENRQIVLTNSYTDFCDNLNVDTMGIQANCWLGIPMVVKGKVLGEIVIWDDKDNHYLGLQDKQFLTAITDMISFAIENIYLYDYIAEKNGSMKIFESVLPKGISKNSIKSVLSQLLQSIIKSPDTVYTGLFLRSTYKNKWRLINEKFKNNLFSSFGIELMNGFTYLPEDDFEEEEYSFWHKQYISHPLNNVLADAFKHYPASSALLFPFVINQSYMGIWIIAFSEEVEKDFRDDIHLYRFIFYIISQLLEKKALLERKSKYEASMTHMDQMRLIGEMASSTAHHLNNIFSVILGKAQLLQKKLSDTPFCRDLDLISQAAQDGTISVSRFQSTMSGDETSFSLKPISINEIIQEVVEISKPRYEREAQLKGVEYDIQINLGETERILGDASALREVIYNLFNNAIDAMPEGGKLKIQTSQKEDNVLIFISDTGVGIPEEIQHRIFEPFFTTKGKKGNGLGLSIVVNIIRKLKGRVYVDSIPNKGSIFMIELPVMSKTLESEEQPSGARRDRTNFKVLLVEDEGIVRETFAEMLEERGYEVTTASNAEEALLNFQKYQCNLVFSDLTMPDINGIELAKKLKKINSEVPVFIITGWNEKDAEIKKFNGVIDGIIHKPFNMDSIEREIFKVLQER